MKKAGFIIAFLGIIFAVMSFQDSIAAVRPWKDLYAEGTNISSVSTWDTVDIDVLDVFGSFATMTTTENGRKTSEKSYYIIPAYEDGDMRFIGICVPEKEYDLFDQMTEETYDYYYEGKVPEGEIKTIHKTGRLTKMNSKMKKYYYDWFTSAQWYDSEEEMKKEVLPYYVDPVADPMSSVKMFGIGLVAFLVGGVICLFGFLKDKSKQQKSEAQSYVTIGGVTYPKQTFAHVNASIIGQEKIFAAQELADITGLSMEEAGSIVEKWNQYYY